MKNFDYNEFIDRLFSFIVIGIPLTFIVFIFIVILPLSMYYENKQICKDGVVYTKNFTQGTFIEDLEYKGVKCTERSVK